MFQVLISILAFVVACLAAYRAISVHLVLKKQKQNLEKQVSDLQRILKFRGNLASEIAHEIKNPITAILCSAETLDMILADKLDEDQRLTLRYIKEYGDNLHKLVSDFLDLSRAEAGNMDYSPRKVDLAQTVQSVMGLLEASAARKGVVLKNLTPGKNVCVHSDPVHLKQILFNLIHNAIKYTKKGGEVTVNCTKAAEQRRVQISVEDNGDGISQEKLDTLFDPYVKYENARDETVIITEAGVPQQGTGIGLAICKSLVELGGGQIKVSSVVDQGSIFSFSLEDTDPDSRKSKSIDQSAVLSENKEPEISSKPTEAAESNEEKSPTRPIFSNQHQSE